MRGEPARIHGGGKQSQWKDAMILLAIYGLADDEGLFCHASNEEIAAMAKLSGVGHSTIRDRIKCLESYEHIYIVKARTVGNPSRIIILADHPDAERMLAEISPKIAKKLATWRRSPYHPNALA